MSESRRGCVEIDLASLPHSEVQRILRTGAPVYLLVNPVEYHGPHLSLHNDFLLSLGVVRDLHPGLQNRVNASWPLIWASPIHLGAGPARGPGSVATPFSRLRDEVISACRGLQRLGAQRVVLMTFHGDPFHNFALEAGVRWLRTHGIGAIAPFHIVLQQLLEIHPGEFDEALACIRDPETRAELSQEISRDFHAGFFETSLALHWAGASVSEHYRGLPRCPEFGIPRVWLALKRAFEKLGCDQLSREMGFIGLAMGWSQLDPFPGYTGRPDLAAKEAGQVFARMIIERILEPVSQALEKKGSGPAPVLRWLMPLTLGGRLAP